jgi:outer membrane lipoprotein-sorting protein
MKAASKTWLSEADGLPRKTETEGELDGKKTRTVVTISDYNADVKIEAPGN